MTIVGNDAAALWLPKSDRARPPKRQAIQNSQGRANAHSSTVLPLRVAHTSRNAKRMSGSAATVTKSVSNKYDEAAMGEKNMSLIGTYKREMSVGRRPQETRWDSV